MLVFNFFKYKRKFFKINIVRNAYSSEKLRLLFFGTDNFSLPSLKILHESRVVKKSNIGSIEVITTFKSPINPVRKFAIDEQIPLHKWPLCKNIDFHNFNIGIVVSFGYLIPSNIIAKFPMGMVNLHASLLPRWRGAAPIVHAIANGDTKTGITIMKIEPKHFDIGDILYQKEVPIHSNTLMLDLYQILAEEGSKLILKTVQNFPECYKDFTKQSDYAVSYAPKVSLEMTKINWVDMTAINIYNLYRALYGYKNIFTKFKNINVKVVQMLYNDSFELRNSRNMLNNKCGSVTYCKADNSLIVLCKNLTYIKIIKLKVEGKKVMSALEFNNGFLKKLSSDENFFE